MRVAKAAPQNASRCLASVSPPSPSSWYADRYANFVKELAKDKAHLPTFGSSQVAEHYRQIHGHLAESANPDPKVLANLERVLRANGETGLPDAPDGEGPLKLSANFNVVFGERGEGELVFAQVRPKPASPCPPTPHTPHPTPFPRSRVALCLAPRLLTCACLSPLHPHSHGQGVCGCQARAKNPLAPCPHSISVRACAHVRMCACVRARGAPSVPLLAKPEHYDAYEPSAMDDKVVENLATMIGTIAEATTAGRQRGQGQGHRHSEL